MKRLGVWGVMLATLAFGLGCKPSNKPAQTPAATQGAGAAPRNPFGVKLDPIPDDDEVRAFAKGVALAGGPDDPNAAAWGMMAAGQGAGLDGEWSGRWKYKGADKPWVNQTAPSRFATVGDRVYILFTYHEGDYLIAALPDGAGRLVGRFVSVVEPRDTGPWVGRIVDNGRIDGQWRGPSGEGRWDFRRQLKK